MSKLQYFTFAQPLLSKTALFFEVKRTRFWRMKLYGNACFIGWGRKRSGEKAKDCAQSYQSSYLLLEDGFIRSLGLGVDGSPAFSIVEDDVGIYYDATVPSKLENLLNTFDFTSDPALLSQAREAMDFIIYHHLSKYNHAPDVPVNHFSSDPSCSRVLVVAQTAGDMSLKYGLGEVFTTDQMLAAAISENPDSTVYLKIHPDVLSGKKESDIDVNGLPESVRVISEDFNPVSLLGCFDKVYTKTSQMGFEALMQGKAVVCFGMPFYAGWGLTDDRVSCTRRRVQRTVEEVFAAAYLLYSRYANPFTNESYDLFKTLRFLNDTRTKLLAHEGHWYVLGISKWKRKFVSNFLGFRASVDFVENVNEAPVNAQVLVWAAYAKPDVIRLLESRGCKVTLLEDGFLRSVGLGINQAPALSLVLDRQGVYYDASKASDLETILNARDFDQACLKRAEALIKKLVALKLTKYNLNAKKQAVTLEAFKEELKYLSAGCRVILVPGQVESDASIQRGSPKIKTNLALLEQVRQDNPQAFIIYKPHPDVLTGLRSGAVTQGADNLFDLQVSDLLMADLLECVDAVHTITSLTGFEALLRNKQVVCYGLPFYAGWGLTEDKLLCERRTRKLTLSELVAGTLIQYPTYADPKTGHLIDVETAVELLRQQKERGAHQLPVYKRIARWLRVNLIQFVDIKR